MFLCNAAILQLCRQDLQCGWVIGQAVDLCWKVPKRSQCLDALYDSCRSLNKRHDTCGDGYWIHEVACMVSTFCDFFDCEKRKEEF